ncbi:MAG: PKD domain-containing protein [Solirubrobacterales bacterium]
MTDYANSAADFEDEEAKAGGFQVELSVRLDLCKRGATYTWRSTAGETTGTGGRGCRVTQTFPEEGHYPVELTVRSPAGRTRSYHREITVRDWLIVSIGDSVASGEGNPDVPSRDSEKARWQSPRCHRSAKAAPAQAALGLEATDPQTSTTFVHLACSGAKLSAGLLGPYKGLDNPLLSWRKPLDPQVDELERIARTRQVDAVLVSVGANDVYFGPIVKFCLQWRSCTKKRFKPKDKRVPKGRLPQVVEKAIARLRAEYDVLARRLSRIVPPSHVVITEYFDPTRDATGKFCERIGTHLSHGRLQIDRAEAEWAATKILQPLNEKIAEEANGHRWTNVSGVAEAFRNHGYCAKEDTWIVQFEDSFFRQIGDSFFSRFAGFLHPNKKGHEVEGKMIGRALDKVLADESLPDPATEVVLVTEAHEQDEEESSGEEAAEEAAEIALAGGAAAAAAMAAGGALRRRRRRPDGKSRIPEGELERPPLDPPQDLLPAESVKAYGELLENLPDWVHRRVESIEILDEEMVRRRVSIDFTPRLPRWEDERGAPDVKCAPIALLAKRVLSRFDLRDESGASVPLATSEENAAFATAYMLEIAGDVLGGDLPPELRRLCWTIARGEPSEANAAIADIASELPGAASQALRANKRFRAATSTFAENFAVLVDVENSKRRRVLKLAYDQLMELDGLTWRQKLGLAPVLMKFRIPELGDAGSRHLEFVRVEGLDILSAQLVWQEPDGPIQGVEGIRRGGDAHVRINRKRQGTTALTGVRVRASKSSLLLRGPWIAALSAGALTAAWFALPGIAGDSSGGAPSILLAVPAFFGVYLGTRQPHPLEAALLLGARTLVYISGFLAFLGAGALSLEPSVEPLRILLGLAALLGWVTVGLLTVIAMQPSSRSAVTGGG